uniref:SAM domain-containing protein n=1 Tax=Amorphochlora amoebiformis TaxID=1561963 RepID=A0A7S0DH29_9EUKA|mmetsp:Transcript_28006/g.44565  ORF Transcript_28006/g.44565 Transcript_28006/m.44565 type:complete len:360 (+) Transcript_28006:72-1151(+)
MSKKGSGKGRLSQKTYNNLRQKKADISKENDTLARETMKMAGRLEALRNYLAEEKKNRSLLPGGTRWGGARKVQGDYMKVVMNRITKKVEADLINKKKRRAKNKDFARKQSTNTNPTIRPGSSYASPIQSTRDKGKGLLARLLEDFPAVVRKEMDIFSDEDAILLTREDLMDICGKAQGIRLFRRLHPPRKSPEPSPELRDVRPEPIISPKPGQVSADPKPESKHSPRNPQALGSQRGEGLLDGHFDEKGGHEEFLKAREAFLREISDGAGSLGVPQKSPKNELLLEGKFDEKSGHEEFLKAREEFLAGLKGGSTPILRELEEPPVDAENLLEGKFDERRNHSEFLQARKMFLTEEDLR